MRLRQIEVFHAIYTAGSITAAARLLNVSQPSVSKVLAHAEQQLGFDLFERVRGRLVPTREAEQLIPHVIEAYASIGNLRRVSENLGNPDGGHVRIASTPAFGIDLVPSAIAAFRRRHPDAVFDIETLHYHQVVRALQQSRVDMALVFAPTTVPGIAVEVLREAEFVAVIGQAESAALPRGDRLPLESLANCPFINLSGRSPLAPLLSAYLEAIGFTPQTVASTETYQMAKALVAHGGGAAIIDEFTARAEGHECVAIRRLEPPLHFEVGLLHPESQPLSVAARRFVAQLREDLDAFLALPLEHGATASTLAHGAQLPRPRHERTG